MNILTYQQQWNKLTEAYIKNEIDPHNNCACFVGNLLGGSELWANCRNIDIDKVTGNSVAIISLLDAAWMKRVLATEGYSFYTPMDVINLEDAFLNTYYQNGGKGTDTIDVDEDEDEDNTYSDSPINENALFAAFEKTLDLLKQIHIEKGDIIDEVKPFVKRKLCSHAQQI